MQLDLSAEFEPAVAAVVAAVDTLEDSAGESLGAVVAHIGDPCGGAAEVWVAAQPLSRWPSSPPRLIDVGSFVVQSESVHEFPDVWFGDLVPDAEGRVLIDVVKPDRTVSSVDLNDEAQFSACLLDFLDSVIEHKLVSEALQRLSAETLHIVTCFAWGEQRTMTWTRPN